MTTLTPVIMSGGSGTRLWPLSRKANPKQYRALVTDNSMFEETVSRVNGRGAEAPIVICARQDAARIAGLSPAARIVTEPMGRNTAPVAIVASLHVQAADPDGLVLLLPADHHVRDPEAFWDAVKRGQGAAEAGHLVTLGIKPTGPETGYGYIKRGEGLADGVYRVDAFREKPDAATAQDYLNEGTYAWNAGIFLFRARDLLAEAERLVPDMLAATRTAYEASVSDDIALHLDEATFANVPADSIDYAIMERTDKAAVVDPVDIGWDDIGSWSAVSGLARGEDSSASVGDVIMVDCEDSYVRSDGPLVAAVGVKGLVIVAMDDTVLVIDESRAQDVKTIIEQLKADKRGDLL